MGRPSLDKSKTAKDRVEQIEKQQKLKLAETDRMANRKERKTLGDFEAHKESKENDEIKYKFTFDHERGDVRPRHFMPDKPEAGVTIGAGYDCGNRSEKEILKDLHAIGMDNTEKGKKTAELLSTAANKKGEDAKKWCDENSKKIWIDKTTEQKLWQHMVPKYEQRIRDYFDNSKKYGSGTWDKLDDSQKGMLFDKAYHTGGLQGWPEFTAAVVRKDWNAVVKHNHYKNNGSADRVNAFNKTFVPGYEEK